MNRSSEEEFGLGRTVPCLLVLVCIYNFGCRCSTFFLLCDVLDWIYEVYIGCKEVIPCFKLNIVAFLVSISCIFKLRQNCYQLY